jgi:S-methylmethionine-dependent homocysteine/selenocysteine methylase
MLPFSLRKHYLICEETSMPEYKDLKERIDRGEVIILDGAIGTQLQAMGAPNDPYCWAAIANHTHPYTVRKMHEDYIKAGAEIITTNTYSSARHNYEPAGLADLVYELNLRAVVLAQEARQRVAKKPAYIAGSVSNFGAWTEAIHNKWSESGQLRGRSTDFGMRMHGVMTEQQIRRNLDEQVEILADAGVDFLITEATGEFQQRKWVLEAVAASGLPFWAGYKCHRDEKTDEILSGYESDMLLAEELEALLPIGGDVVTIFHSDIEDTTKAIPIVKSKWSGPIAVYPEAGRRDYVYDLADPRETNEHSIAEWVQFARDRLSEGVQIIGGCCGIGVEYIEALRGKL